MLVEPVVRVKLWTQKGGIVYSDEIRLIDSSYELDEDDLEVLDDGGVVSEVSDLSGPENRFERSFGELLEVYTRIETRPTARRCCSRRTSAPRASPSVAASSTATFVPVLVATLVALALLMVPIAWILASRVRASQREREGLMQRAIESSDRERRRIAGDLHDGPVQEMAGLSMRLSAAAGHTTDEGSAGVLRDSATAVRGSVRTLRSAVVGVYPPNLQQVGLAASLSDLVARLTAQGVDATVEVDPAATFGPDADALLYRVAQEAVRNAEEHAAARTVRIVVGVDRDRRRARGDRRRPWHRPRSRGAGARRGTRRPVDPRGPRRRRGWHAHRPARGAGRDGRTRGGADVVIRVAIADDHRVVRVGLEQLLLTFDDVEFVGAADGGAGAVDLCAVTHPDVLLLDLSMPEVDGIEVTRRLREVAPDTRVVVFTSFSDRDRIVQALDAGAVGYLLKDAEPEELHAAVQAASRGEAPLTPKAAAALLADRRDRPPEVQLTAREQEVLGLVVEGLANKQIARRMGISEKTVKGHLTNLFQRIGVVDRTQAALWAERAGIFRDR